MKKNVYNDIPDISQDILKTNLKKITDHINKEVDKIYGSEKIVNEEIKLTYKINEHGFRTHSMRECQRNFEDKNSISKDMWMKSEFQYEEWVPYDWQ